MHTARKESSEVDAKSQREKSQIMSQIGPVPNHRPCQSAEMPRTGP